MHSRWQGGVQAEWAKLEKVEEITEDDIAELYLEEETRAACGDPRAQCLVYSMDSLEPIYKLPFPSKEDSEEDQNQEDEEDNKLDAPVNCGVYPGGGLLFQGEHFYIIAARVVNPSYDVYWKTAYRVIFEPTTETEIIEIAKKVFVEMVDSVWRNGYYGEIHWDWDFLKENKWNVDSVELYTEDMLREHWNSDDNLGYRALKGPAYLTVTKYRRTGDHGTPIQLVYSLPTEIIPVTNKKSARK